MLKDTTVMSNDNILNWLWDCISSETPLATKEEKHFMKIIVEKEDELSKTLNKKESKLFHDYQEAVYELSLIDQKQSFAKGVKFATNYLIKTFEK